MNLERESLMKEYYGTVLELARIADTLKCPIDFIIENANKFSPSHAHKIESIIERQVVIWKAIRKIDVKAFCSRSVVNLNEYKQLIAAYTPLVNSYITLLGRQ